MAIGMWAAGPAAGRMDDGHHGGQSRKQVFSTEIAEKSKDTEGTERILFETFRDVGLAFAHHGFSATYVDLDFPVTIVL